jgi:hypothetical protein
MNGSGFDKNLAIGIVVLVLCGTAAGLGSRYAAAQAGAYLAQQADAELNAPARHSVWNTLRTGQIVGRAVSARQDSAYLIAIKRQGGEYRAIARSEADGSLVSVVPLGANAGFSYAPRLDALFARAAGVAKHGDDSPIDPALKPMIVDALETIATLERSRTEAINGQ